MSHELVFDAIRKHQKSGNRDYIILDRCAGTGNLELELNDNVPDDIIDKDILNHVIVNTYEYYEYRVLMERLGDKVRWIIPPTEDETTYMNGLVRGSNALSEEFIENEVIQQYVKDDSVTMIVFENPPFGEPTSINHQKAKRGKSSSAWKQDRGTVEAKKALKGARSNEMANVFIWTAMNYYLRQPHDSLIVFSPLKYWKNGDWMNLTFERGFAMNRRHFHTKQNTVVSCIHWTNTPSDSKTVRLEAVEIEGIIRETVTSERVSSFFSKKYYDKRTSSNDLVRPPLEAGQKAIWAAKSGLELDQEKVRVSARFNENIVGYLVAQSSTFESPRSTTLLTRVTQYNGNGFHLRADNFLEKLPMFAAGWWSDYNDKWWLDGVIYRSGDGAERFLADVETKKLETMEWLHKVLFYTTMEYYTKIRSLNGSDGRLYFNELCLDNNIDHSGYGDKLMHSLGTKTLAYKTLEDAGFFEQMTDQEQAMFGLYQTILAQAKNTANYNPDFNYGLFQIGQELNTKHKERRGTKEVNVYDYPELNGNLKTMRKLVKDYYHDKIVDGLFAYEFLK